MNNLPTNIRSLRTRLILGTGAMLLPLLLLATVGYVLFQSVMGNIDRVVQGVSQELVPVSYLQAAVQRDRYVIDRAVVHGEPDARGAYAALSQHIDSAFARLLARDSVLPADLSNALRQAHGTWRQAKREGASLLSTGGDRNNAAALRRLSVDLDTLDHDLQDIYSRILADMNRQMAHAQTARRNVLLLIGSISTIGLLLAIGAAFLLARTILLPLAELEHAAKRFGTGDLRHRIRHLPHHELGEVARTFNAMADTIEKHQASLQHMAMRDALTGLLNRREFKARLGTELERARRYSHPFALLLIDIDHFKIVNDTYGHPAGDRVLVALAGALHDGMRPADTLARYGGEEFAVVLPEIHAEEAMAAAERLRASIASLPVALDERSLRLTISIGVAVFPQHGGRNDTLLRRADRALYTAKAAGRNQVALANPDKEPPSTPN